MAVRKIYYMRPEYFSTGILGPTWIRSTSAQLPTFSTIDATHIFVVEFEIKNHDAAYIRMQMGYWAERGQEESDRIISSLGLNHTTMCVGDVIVYRDVAHMVDNIGFYRLPTM